MNNPSDALHRPALRSNQLLITCITKEDMNIHKYSVRTFNTAYYSPIIKYLINTNILAFGSKIQVLIKRLSTHQLT